MEIDVQLTLMGKSPLRNRDVKKAQTRCEEEMK